MKDKYTFKITINDTFCVYEYDISTDGSFSIHDIAQSIHAFVKSDGPLEGKHVKNLGEDLTDD